MIIFPVNFIQLPKYPGYYYNIVDKLLYSCKSGELKPLTISKQYWTKGKLIPEGYRVSIKGVRRLISISDLLQTKFPEEVQIFPIKG